MCRRAGLGRPCDAGAGRCPDDRRPHPGADGTRPVTVPEKEGRLAIPP